MIAHIRESDQETQSLAVHSQTVSKLCERAAKTIGLPHLAALIGLLHDMGKATSAFQAYLYAAQTNSDATSPHYHAHTGAIYVFRQWFSPANQSPIRRLTAQIAMLCIHGHHAGLADCWSFQGGAPLLQSLKDNEKSAHADEAIAWFLSNVADEATLNQQFAESCEEMAALFPDVSECCKQHPAMLGLLCRTLLSILVDADRWDSACFVYGEDPLTVPASPNWQELLGRFERFRSAHLDGTGDINRIRGEISEACYEQAADASGIFTLSVPTGGGKTYASLRYALRHAQVNGQQRIFYIIPYNTILDQNAKDIREALDNYPSMLEHHANVVVETEEEQQAYKRLTERWDSDIILTSLVQFLNACYDEPNSAARRMYRLTNAVLIFDEIQSLPKRCKKLFERVADFLATYGHSTVILCTATQPRLSLSPAPKELMPNVNALYAQMKRVQYFSQWDAKRTYASAGAQIAQMLTEKSVLAILNVKRAAWEVYQEATAVLQEEGWSLVPIDPEMPESALMDKAEHTPDDQILCVHLSTQLCPAHRKQLLAWVKSYLKAGKRVLCVSTALIEAGINVSFPIVIRDLAGLPSIVQAAGRANRSREYDRGEVLIWDFPQEAEALGCLKDVQNEANISRSILASGAIPPERWDAPETLNGYFKRMQDYIEDESLFPVMVDEGAKTEKRYLVHLLALNKAYANDREDLSKEFPLHQSFRTAAEHFYVIKDNTVPVIVPWGEGKEIIAALAGRHAMREEVQLLRRAQAYTVNLYQDTYKRLDQAGAIAKIGESNVCVLKEGYYSAEAGVVMEQAELESYYF